jgi:ATP-dependent exoDNAse (exonuclease V) beta subunit
VLARELVRSDRHGEAVRGRLQDRYRRILLDEFQDADPIQIELAVRIAGGAAGGAADWRDVPIPEGSLFVVGDPKQSIYRFRRADIATYLEAQDGIGRSVQLTTNFRTTASVVAWVNTVFDRLIVAEPGSQPAYRALDADRGDAPGGTNVVVLGAEAHPRETKAPAVRDAEAAEVADVIRTAVAEGWQVYDGATDRWRRVRLGDVAVLVPARTSLPQLEAALDAADVPFRAEASSLVYRTPEVRDLLMTARAVDDPSDALALGQRAALARLRLRRRRPLDVEARGRTFNSWHLIRDGVPEDHPVRVAVTYLRALHDERNARAPSELLDRIARDRRLFEVAGVGTRGRDVWRRLRFVIDHSRAWSESEHGALRSYLGWARRQGDESARVAEAILPETTRTRSVS